MNDRYSVIYNEEARKDIKEIYAYIAFKLMVPITAEDQINRIRKLIHSLDCMPSRYPIIRIFYDGQDVEGITSHISTDN